MAGESAQRDRATPTPRRRRRLRGAIEVVLLVALAAVMLFPAAWMLENSIKEQRDIYAVPAKFVSFEPTLAHYEDLYEGGGTASALDLRANFANSIIIAGFSTLLATLLGVPAAWAYSRFSVRARKHQLFFILSTRFMPPVVVVVPIFLMYRDLGLIDTRLGMILLYAAFNLPFTIWMMKGFVDEVPAEYEEAGMLDGYSRFEAFTRFTLPLLVPGIMATVVFALIFAWNEFVFAFFITQSEASRTVPPAIANLLSAVPLDWGLVSATLTIYAIPVLLFTFLVRRHLVAGVTMGVIRK
jgi:multiple sugar transport system permease protein